MRRSLYSLPVLCLILAGVAVCLPSETAGVGSSRAADKPPAKPAEHKSYVEKVAGTDVKFDMIAIPGGTFEMGSPNDEPGRKIDEGPRHPVTIRPFWMGKCEVSWDEYDLYWKKHEGENEEKKNDHDKAEDDQADQQFDERGAGLCPAPPLLAAGHQ